MAVATAAFKLSASASSGWLSNAIELKTLRNAIGFSANHYESEVVFGTSI